MFGSGLFYFNNLKYFADYKGPLLQRILTFGNLADNKAII